MSGIEVLVGLGIAVGLVGVVVPVLPGSLLILGSVLGWTLADGSRTAWLVLAGVTVLLAAGAVVKYAVPGRRLQAAGIPNRSLVVGGLLGIVGFFVIPVVGLFLGLVLGIYLSESQRLGPDRAWPSTKAALRAVGTSVLIELAAGVLAACTWAAGAVLT